MIKLNAQTYKEASAVLNYVKPTANEQHEREKKIFGSTVIEHEPDTTPKFLYFILANIKPQ